LALCADSFVCILRIFKGENLMGLLPNGPHDFDVNDRDYYARNEEDNNKKYHIVLVVDRAEFIASERVVPKIPDESHGKGQAPDNNYDEDSPASGHQYGVLQGLVHR